MNASAIGRRLGVSPPTVRRRVGLLQELGLVRLLEHVPAEIADGPRRRPAPYLCRSWPVGRMPSARAPRPRPLFRRPRRPRVFLRDPRLVGITEAADDRIFRGRLIERLIALQQALRPQSRFWYWSVPGGCGIDLVVETEPGRRIGFQLRRTASPQRWDCNRLRFAWQEGLIERGYLLYTGRRAYFTCRIVAVVPFRPFLARYGEWAGLRSNRDVLDALGRIGQSRDRVLDDRASYEYPSGENSTNFSARGKNVRTRRDSRPVPAEHEPEGGHHRHRRGGADRDRPLQLLRGGPEGTGGRFIVRKV